MHYYVIRKISLIIGASAASPTLVVKTENCLFIGASAASPTLMDKTKICLYIYLLGLAALAPHLWIKRKFVYIYIYLYIYIYIWYVRIPYIYTSCPNCARCNISTLHVGSCNHCCSRDKTNKTERLNSGNQRNRNLKTVRKGRHYYQDGG